MLDPGSAIGWANRGNALNALGRYVEAIDSYVKALSLDPGMGWVRSYLEQAKQNQGSV